MLSVIYHNCQTVRGGTPGISCIWLYGVEDSREVPVSNQLDSRAACQGSCPAHTVAGPQVRLQPQLTLVLVKPPSTCVFSLGS